MKYIAGVDIGNSTTEVCVGRIDEEGKLQFLASHSEMTTGTKGTTANVTGITTALAAALSSASMSMQQLDLIRINEAAPVIGDTAMETITETIITESSMIGHNPSTPAGAGHAVGETIRLSHARDMQADVPYIVLVNHMTPFEEAAAAINHYAETRTITAVILQADEAVLVANRLRHKVPIIDEVKNIQDIPEHKTAAVEVALPQESIRMLSNPYGIATLLSLDARETKMVTPIAKSLIGKRSAVVIKTPYGKVQENVLPAGTLHIRAVSKTGAGQLEEISVPIDSGAEAIMRTVNAVPSIEDVHGDADTNVGNMFAKIKQGMQMLSEERDTQVRITDLLAVDTLAPVQIAGALAGETCLEKAVGIAAMVKTAQLPMERIAALLREQLHVNVKVAGVEAVMAAIGALTTPGTTLPLAILDLGGGSTDAAIIKEDGSVATTHKAGAGELVSMLIQEELGLKSRMMAEQIKRYPLGKVESLFHMRLESGAVRFFEEPTDPRYFGNVALLNGAEMIKIEEDIPLEKILSVRKEAKKKVFVTNALRALREIAPDHELRNIPNIVLVGGSAEDFEIPEMLMEEFSNYKIVCGRGNIRRTQGPRNAVATGLVLSYLGGASDGE
ncbi:MAG: diol dehydratase reactivase subunit alpha [Lachnospiraceae bacterium]